MKTANTDVIDHFTARAAHYDRSSKWCSDPEMMEWLVQLCTPRHTDSMLDVACGTGLLPKAFRAHVGNIVGVDPTPAMAVQALPWIDRHVQAFAERLPFADGTFDLTTCRQGLQFMDVESAAREMVRVTKPAGRVVLIHLCAYGDGDEQEYFEVLRLRNPARRNFFVPADISAILTRAGCASVDLFTWQIDEDVELWADNQAIPSANQEGIRALYRNPSERFSELHCLRHLDGGRVIDRMLFAVAIGRP
jgi:SAM-dependent methyltransferase